MANKAAINPVSRYGWRGATILPIEYFGEHPRLKYWDGASWVAKPLKYWNGLSWVEKPLKYWNGLSWS